MAFKEIINVLELLENASAEADKLPHLHYLRARYKELGYSLFNLYSLRFLQ